MGKHKIMVKLQTIVNCGKSKLNFDPDFPVFVIGSCFADNIGKKMQNAGCNVMVNPAGTVYNPVSISNTLARISKNIKFTPEDCIEMGANAGLICSFYHHTSFARRDVESFLKNANESLEQAHVFFEKCKTIMISLGTSWIYRRGDMVVSNCLKRNAGEFEREFIDNEKTYAVLHSMMKKFDDKNFVFTVSPIRHLRDGANGNQISKASLLIATDKIVRTFPERAEYFPAYELLLDQMRDYRFYAGDLVHPSDLAVDIIWENFMDFAFDDKQKNKLLENEKLYKRSLHRPINHL